ncbi:MurR/RpiR family transcriptional regulator [Thermoanaerobacterium sp. RBIITD]|uniref:MurR/RpiR family transcriptional regulator n=1 Tax=Thermoanaerobacterium sp. RBIITD TaxID=1550240 RepID=UPI000BB8FA71|nr:MurR/RpiR family transcriptional regulator [Thermoanaerobacterium sp. RBIITD]SNX54584.1 transcriptional regulator, RpiR family [Thermoanaerobacterium sp. RBIITD]
MQEQNSVVLKIRSVYNSLTNAEKKVADYVLNNTEEVIYSSVTELAEKINVGETTIVRFCRHIGLTGFQDFKLNIAKETVSPETSIHENITFNDTTNVLVQKITTENTLAISNTMRMLSISELERAVEEITKANKIEIYGVGASGYTALDAKYKFMRLGLNVDANLDAHIQAISAVNLNENDVAIGISFSGSTKDTVETCRLAKESGAKIICITNYARSPITAVADIILLTSAKETPLRSGALTSKIAQLHILDILYTCVAIKMKDKAVQGLNKTAKAVLDKLY